MKRIDVWAIVDITGMWYMNSLFPKDASNFKYTKAFNRGDICVIFSKKQDPDSTYAKAFKAGFEKIKANGEYLKIMAKYYGGIAKINEDSLTNDMQIYLQKSRK